MQAAPDWLQTEDSLQKLPLKANNAVPDAVAKKSASLPENAMHHVQQNTKQVHRRKYQPLVPDELYVRISLLLP